MIRDIFIFLGLIKNRQRGDSKKELRSAETDIWLGGNLTLKDTFNRTTTVSRPYPKINRGLLRKNGSKVHFLEKMPLKIRYLTVIMGMFHKPLIIFVRWDVPDTDMTREIRAEGRPTSQKPIRFVENSLFKISFVEITITR